ncbi:crossover junction endodeoxyribonuclease RuvC [Achromobacter deleyi]|uniref:Crossover junction endodeoxyribonuclease RuvC n=1 Tax=Achromobacter deleyi TaxID=1353891 RepID=A0A7T4B940_9BURK|nr:crossover junction endodeoxyribonuclease RuvC [Achromobacter deleyi]QQB37974.1 crossover junction endodeoxyribonuclease RuvC [Achromobacter deleyi]
MTLPNLTPQGADVALDPMQGTLNDRIRTLAVACGGYALDAPDSFARVDAVPDPWAWDGAQSSMIIPESRANAGSGVAPSVGLNINILALDLGTKTGYALRRRDGAMRYGTVDFTPRKSWTPGQRWARFRGWLADTVATFQIDAIVYERVVFGHSSAASSDVYGGFKALVELAADTHSLTLSSVAVPTVKKHFTGSGRADKDAMMAQAKARGFSPDSHNAADALAILHWAVDQERKA